MRVPEFGENFVGFAIIIEIDQESELDGKALLDGLGSPFGLPAAAAWVLPPPQGTAEPGAAYDVGMPVAINVERQVAEVIDIAVAIGDLAEAVAFPGRRLVPVFTGDNIELAVAIDVGDGGGFTGADIDLVFMEWDVGRTGDTE